MRGPSREARITDWAQVQERFSRPLYEAVLEEVGVGAGMAVLDVGCGAGLFCALARDLGARICGIDTSEAFVAIARMRAPGAEFRVGEIEALPYGDHTFDIVTGFNSFQFAPRPLTALAEARRVARPGAAVLVATWGKPEQSEGAQCLAVVGALLWSEPPDAASPLTPSAVDAQDAFVRAAGLMPRSVSEVECVFEYPDLDAALRGLLSVGPAVRAIRESGEDRVRDALAAALVPYRLSTGGYRLENTMLFTVATANPAQARADIRRLGHCGDSQEGRMEWTQPGQTPRPRDGRPLKN